MIRRFRIWDSRNKVELRWRYYSIERHAQDHALIMVRWSPVNATLEVIDAEIGKHLGTYQRRLHDIVFYPPDHVKRRPYGETQNEEKHQAANRNSKGKPVGKGKRRPEYPAGLSTSPPSSRRPQANRRQGKEHHAN